MASRSVPQGRFTASTSADSYSTCCNGEAPGTLRSRRLQPELLAVRQPEARVHAVVEQRRRHEASRVAGERAAIGSDPARARPYSKRRRGPARGSGNRAARARHGLELEPLRLTRDLEQDRDRLAGGAGGEDRSDLAVAQPEGQIGLLRDGAGLGRSGRGNGEEEREREGLQTTEVSHQGGFFPRGKGGNAPTRSPARGVGHYKESRRASGAAISVAAPPAHPWGRAGRAAGELVRWRTPGPSVSGRLDAHRSGLDRERRAATRGVRPTFLHRPGKRQEEVRARLPERYRLRGGASIASSCAGWRVGAFPQSPAARGACASTTLPSCPTRCSTSSCSRGRARLSPTLEALTPGLGTDAWIAASTVPSGAPLALGAASLPAELEAVTVQAAAIDRAGCAHPTNAVELSLR